MKEFLKKLFAPMLENKWKTNPKRVAVIFTITVLSFMVILEGVFCISLYRANSLPNFTPSDFAHKDQSEQSGKKREAIKLLNEINSIYMSNYVYDIDDDKLLDELLKAYNAASEDRYFEYLTAEEWAAQKNTQSGGASIGIGVSVNITEERILVIEVYKDSPAARAGIVPGDKIVSVDGQNVVGLSSDEVISRIKGTPDTVVTVTVLRDGATQDLEVTRGDYVVQTVFPSLLEQNGKQISYIRVSNFYQSSVADFKAALLAAKEAGVAGIIFDMRSNPGGELNAVTAMADMLLPEGPICHLHVTGEEEAFEYESDANMLVELPMVVLTDGNTASAAELFSSALRDYDKAYLIGTKTFGKGCGQTYFKLSNGGYFKLTNFYYDPPYGENYNGSGIEPNLEVLLPEEEADTPISILPFNVDTQLKAALDYLTK